MKKLIILIFFISVSFSAAAQKETFSKLRWTDSPYISVTYNHLLSMPEGMKADYGLSTSFGYIHDISFTPERNIAVGIGLGFSLSNYYTNLLFLERIDASSPYNSRFLLETSVDDNNKTRNKFSQRSLDLPVQLRFRGSPAKHKNFWKVYVGLTPKFSVINFSSFVSKSTDKKETLRNANFYNPWQVQAHFEAGWGPVSLYASYDLLGFFKQQKEGGITFYTGVNDLDKIRSANVGIKLSLSARKNFNTYTDIDGIRKTLIQ